MSLPIVHVVVLALTFGFGAVAVVYEVYADSSGWPVGEWYRSETSFPTILGMLAVLGAPIAALVLLPWWFALIVVVTGLAIALFMMIALGPSVQVLTILALPACWIVGIWVFWSSW